jgi:hypothetical protein
MNKNNSTFIWVGVVALAYLIYSKGKASGGALVPPSNFDCNVSNKNTLDYVAQNIKAKIDETGRMGTDDVNYLIEQFKNFKSACDVKYVYQTLGTMAGWGWFGVNSGDLFWQVRERFNEYNKERAKPYFFTYANQLD